ncbi:hypothetical protein CH063_12831, partial [Colletotrichum higginsianum]
VVGSCDADSESERGRPAGQGLTYSVIGPPSSVREWRDVCVCVCVCVCTRWRCERGLCKKG